VAEVHQAAAKANCRAFGRPANEAVDATNGPDPTAEVEGKRRNWLPASDSAAVHQPAARQVVLGRWWGVSSTSGIWRLVLCS
jgi:hypothetical protein